MTISGALFIFHYFLLVILLVKSILLVKEYCRMDVSLKFFIFMCDLGLYL